MISCDDFTENRDDDIEPELVLVSFLNQTHVNDVSVVTKRFQHRLSIKYFLTYVYTLPS